MDPLSVAASVIAILQLTGEVIKYLNDVKDAPRECQQCTIEASNLQNLLINLRYCLEQGQTSDLWFTGVQALNVENGPLDQYKQALEQLQSKVEIQNGAQKIMKRLSWKFSKAEVTSILGRMERLKSLVSIALEMDHIKLSQAIKTCVDTLYKDNQMIKDNTIYVRNALPSLYTTVTALYEAKDLQRHDMIMQWLSVTEFPAQQQDIISRRQESTGQWFLDSSEFKGWLRGADTTLFCPGIPGAGKTMIAAIAVDHLCRTVWRDDIGVAYLFCNYKAQVDQSASSLLAALLKQLVQSRPDIAAPVTDIYDQHSKQRSRPSLDDIFRALQSVCLNYAVIYIILDALDECVDKDGARGQLIYKLCELQTSTGVRCMFTSRFIPEITQKFCSNPTLEIRASKEDVGRFLAGRMPSLPNCIQRDDELKLAVQDKIIDSVDGMFLLARLHVDSLLDKRNKQKVLSTLDKLLKGSAALDKAYSEAIKRIDGQLADDRSLARLALSWITHAQRLLTTEELCHALAIEPGDKALNNDNVYDVEDVISVCAGLVTVDEESNIIRLVHYTTQEYFERVCLEWNPGAQEAIAVACLTYLSFDVFRSGSCANDKAFQKRLAMNAFFDYSAHYWSEHIRPVESTTSRLALTFLRDEALVDCTIQAASTLKHKYKNYSKRFPHRTSGLHLVARNGLLYLIERLLIGKHRDSNIGADLKDGWGQTPLSWAAVGGHEAVVKLLIGRDDVEVNSKDEWGRTPLFRAAGGGHEAVVKLLIGRDDIEADLKDEGGQTPLSRAAGGGHEAVVKLLIGRDDVEADSKDEWGWMPLSRAAGGGHEAVVKLLIGRDDVEADSKDEWGRTPLSQAAEGGHEAVVKLLIRRDDIEVDSKDERGQTPLSWAAGGGHEAVVKLLIRRDDVEANSKGKGGQTPLSRAAGGGHEAVVKLLIGRDDVEANSKGEGGQTPLSRAAEGGHEAVVKLLIGRDDVEADSKDSYGQTPLSWAAGGGHEVVVKLLIGRDDVEVDSKNNIGQTPLSHAARGGHEAVVKLLIGRDDVEADSKDSYGQTPLSWAAGGGHEAVVKLLEYFIATKLVIK